MKGLNFQGVQEQKMARANETPPSAEFFGFPSGSHALAGNAACGLKHGWRLGISFNLFLHILTAQERNTRDSCAYGSGQQRREADNHMAGDYLRHVSTSIDTRRNIGAESR
jgi:hypothetical protein